MSKAPFTMIEDWNDGRGSKLVICKSIPYIITPSPTEAGHIVSIPDFVTNQLCTLGVVETFEKGVQFAQTLNKDHLLAAA